MELWNLHTVATTYGTRPSSILGLPQDSWIAYQLDLAVVKFGRWVEGELAETDSKGKPKKRLADLLRDEGEQSMDDSAFAPMKDVAARKVQIKPDGTWD